MSKNIQEDLLPKTVTDDKTYTWRLQLYERGGSLWGTWDTPDFELDGSHLVLYVPDEDPIRVPLGKPSGRHSFKRPRGAGFRLALVAKGFDGKEMEIVTTAVTEGTDKPMPPAVTAKLDFSVTLENVDGKAMLRWSSTGLPFRPRESQYQVYEEGREVKWDWITQPQGSVPTDIRWGVGLRAAYTAERYGGHAPGRVEVVTTPITG